MLTEQMLNYSSSKLLAFLHSLIHFMPLLSGERRGGGGVVGFDIVFSVLPYDYVPILCAPELKMH